jgi:hypothetical protein
MIAEITMWQITCDRCGRTPGLETVAWQSPESARAEAHGCEWAHEDGTHFCCDCQLAIELEKDQDE